MGDFERVRAIVIASSFLLVIPLLFAGAIFGLNGEQWSWWKYGAWLSAAVVCVGGACVAVRRWKVRRRPRNSHWKAGAVLGGAVVVASLAGMSRNYSDPYGGPMFWPHFLAAAAFVGLVVAEASLVVGALRDDFTGHR